MNFIDALRAGWSISIFHYRNHGADVGRIVVGVLVPKGSIQAGQGSWTSWDTPAREETENPAYKLFL